MGNFFEPGSGSADGDFVGEEEKNVLLYTKVVFPILKVIKRPEGKFGPKYEISTVLPGSEDPRVLSFSADSVPNRAAGLEAIIDAQDAGTYSPINVRMEKDGRATVLVEVEEGAE